MDKITEVALLKKFYMILLFNSTDYIIPKKETKYHDTCRNESWLCGFIHGIIIRLMVRPSVFNIIVKYGSSP